MRVVADYMFIHMFSFRVGIGVGLGLLGYVIGIVIVEPTALLRGLNNLVQLTADAIAERLGGQWLPGRRLWQFGYWMDKMSSRSCILEAENETERQRALWKV